MTLRMALWFCSRSLLITHSCLKSTGVGDDGSCAEGAQKPFELPPMLSLENYAGVLLATVVYSWFLLSSWLCIFAVSHIKETLHVERKKRGRYIVSEWHRYTVIKTSIEKSISYRSPYLRRFLDRTTVWQTTELLNLYRAQNEVMGIILKSN